MISVAITTAPLDPLAILAMVERQGAGAVASFSGFVRADDGVATLELEHYPGMTETALEAVAQQAVERWHLLAIAIVHRVGAMVPGDHIVMVATAAAHRGAAMEACGYAIDRLKTDAPFWKRETTANESRWVAARMSDGDAARRWQEPSGVAPIGTTPE